MAEAPSKLSVTTLGHTGVVIDPDPLEPAVPEDALLSAQNATHDPKAAHAGAIRKRPGLIQFNPAFAGGVILGGIMMPVAGSGGAPASGGGAFLGTGDSDDGTSVGTGDMTGAPGATFDGGSIATAEGSGAFGGGSLFSGARLIIVGRNTNSGATPNFGGNSWYVNSKNLANVPTTVTSPGPAVAVYAFPPVSPFTYAFGKATCIDNIGSRGLYYAASHNDQTLPRDEDYVSQEFRPTIRNTNGVYDVLVSTVPYSTDQRAGIAGQGHFGLLFTSDPNPGTTYQSGDIITLSGGTGSAASYTFGTSTLNLGDYTVSPSFPAATTGGHGLGTGVAASAVPKVTRQRTAIVDMHYATDGFIYICVKDKYNGQTSAGSAGRVFRLAPLTGELVEWNLIGSVSPGTSPNFYDRVPYCCNYFDGRLYVGHFPDVIDDTQIVYSTDGNTSQFEIGVNAFTSCMAQYNGRLWVGNGAWSASPSFGSMWSRAPGPLSGGSWLEIFGATGGVATNGNYFHSLVEFKGALYASWFGNNTNAKIYKIVANVPGDPTSTSFTVTTAISNPTLTAVPYNLYVDDGVLYAICPNESTPNPAFITSDGTTWTDKTTAFPSGGVNAGCIPAFFAVNQ